MPRKARAMIKPKDPYRFNFRFSKNPDTLKRFKELHEQMRMDNKNLTMNQIISDYWKYQKFKPIIDVLYSMISERIEHMEKRIKRLERESKLN